VKEKYSLLMKGVHEMSTEGNKALVRREVDEVWNQGNLAAADELFAADVIVHGGLPGQPPGVEAIKQGVELNRAAFPDFHVTIDDLIAEGDKVVLRATTRGTHKGELLGMPPTGKQATMTGMTTVRIADGKIAEVWTCSDLFGLMQQLGAIPTPGE
jgi:steroid delta-isomerase-like uncharacterized protein